MPGKGGATLFGYGLGAIGLVCAAFLLFKVLGGGRGKVDLPDPELRQVIQELGGASAQAPVIVLLTEWCPVCRQLEAELQRRGVAYTRADVEKDPMAGKLFNRVSKGYGDGVPKTIVGNRLIVGYQPQAIIDAIAEYRQKPPAGIDQSAT